MPSNILTPVACVSLVVLIFYLRPSKPKKYPPGPKPYPVIGNALDIPLNDDLLSAFDEWKAAYGVYRSIPVTVEFIASSSGPIVHVQALGKHIIVLNTLEVITDLLDRRRKIYSDRPVFQMAGELMGTRDAMTFIPCNDRWRSYRKLVRQILNPQAAASFRQIQTHARDLYIQSLFHEPTKFIRELRL
jgi:hypothetical protein